MAHAENLAPIDYAGFAQTVTTLRKDILAQLGPEDLRHLRRIERWGRFCSVAGYLLAPWFFNPFASLLMSQGNLTRWLLMHHIGHRGYDKVPDVPARYTSSGFARGWRRFVDWFDWILPEAWNYEHNVLHHYHTGETVDPDLVEHNIADSWMARQPRWLRYLIVAFFATTWKISYYAPNTFRQLENVQRQKRGLAPLETWWALFDVRAAHGRAFWRRCVLPYGVMRFVVLPALFLPLGQGAALWVLVNSLVAEAMTNLHTFCVIAPNHAGDDLYRFDTPSGDKAEHYARQVMGSVNFATGGDVNDYGHMWLNYQIEHHVWPDLPMLQYQRWQTRFRAVCQQHGLPYVQESVMRRVRRLVDIMVGKTSMIRVERLMRRSGRRVAVGESA